MELLTKEIISVLEKYPIRSQDNFKDPKVLVKFFNPYGRGTWYVTEAEQLENGDWEFFGLCHIFEAEFGYFMLSDLTSVNVRGIPIIERDTHFSGNISDARKELENM